MRQRLGQFDRFLRAVRGRMIALRLLERAAIGAGIACALALLMVPLLVLRQVAPLPIALVALAVGAAMGLVSALTDRPNMDAAAREADRQLGLHDLLSTAWSMRAGADGWSRAVLAMAEARCAGLAPSQVMLNRLGARWWGGIVASVVLAIGVAALYSIPASTLADAGGSSPFVPIEQIERDARLPPPAGLRLSRPPAADHAAGHAADPASASSDPAAAARSGLSGAPDEGEQGAGHAGALGQGSGEALSTIRRQDRPGVRPSDSEMTDRINGEGDPGDGDGLAGLGSANDGRPDGMTTTPPARRVPVWDAPTWSSARDRAMHSIRDGSVPDTYRPLVRDYFDREAAE